MFWIGRPRSPLRESVAWSKLLCMVAFCSGESDDAPWTLLQHCTGPELQLPLPEDAGAAGGAGCEGEDDGVAVVVEVGVDAGVTAGALDGGGAGDQVGVSVRVLVTVSVRVTVSVTVLSDPPDV